MNSSLKLYIDWFNKNLPDYEQPFEAGATQDQISQVANELSLNVPEDLKQILSFSNGCESPSIFGVLGDFLGTERIIDVWKMNLETAEKENQFLDDIDGDVDGPVKKLYFSKSWLPVFDSDGYVFYAIDYDPEPGGTPGQIIEVSPESCSWKVVAKNISELLDIQQKRLQEG